MDDIILIDKSGVLTRYPFKDFVTKSFDDIASDLGYSNSGEFLAGQIQIIYMNMYVLLTRMVIEMTEFVVSELETYMDEYEAHSNYWGE